MPAKIHGAELPVAKILSDDYYFKIPRYQRPYAWTDEQAGELLDDLLANLNGEVKVDESTSFGYLDWTLSHLRCLSEDRDNSFKTSRKLGDLVPK